jgi:hypothetical protein
MNDYEPDPPGVRFTRRTPDDLNLPEPGHSATFGEQAGWGWAISMLYRVLPSPSAGHPIPNKCTRKLIL